jgi:hypothetical protein
MPNVKFSTLYSTAPASPLNQSDIFAVTQAATSKGATVSQLWPASPVGNANYTIQNTDVLVYTSVAFTGPHTWNLPSAAAYGAGRVLRIADTLGTLTGVNSLTIQRAGTDTIAVGLTNYVLAQAGQSLLLVTDGVSHWSIVAVGISAIGNSFQAITFSAAGNVNSTQGALSTQITTVTVNAGSGAYVGTISLPHTNIAAGDANFFYLNFAASRNPIIQIFDNNTAGTLLFEWDGDGTQTNIAADFFYSGSAWSQRDAHFI